jgi:hypothetical protein
VARAAQVRVKGQKELERAFMELRRETLREIKPAILVAAEPVKREAEDLSVSNISNIGPVWSRMRVGATVKSVYVGLKVRKASGAGTPRPNLAGLLQAQMEAALDDKQEEVAQAVGLVVDESIARNGFV